MPALLPVSLSVPPPRSTAVVTVKLRTCLENLRYRACTPEDIALLESRIASKGPDWSKLNQPRFRNVSVITKLNSDRDEMNRLGSAQFAKDTN